ncbi:MAG: hypothetical protein M1813_008563 [Trichoglossum hirsutum]|nr:MAG: hypothetical protein M1813_008563 [Trichoglossum hirsutum]
MRIAAVQVKNNTEIDSSFTKILNSIELKNNSLTIEIRTDARFKSSDFEIQEIRNSLLVIDSDIDDIEKIKKTFNRVDSEANDIKFKISSNAQLEDSDSMN